MVAQCKMAQLHYLPMTGNVFCSFGYYPPPSSTYKHNHNPALLSKGTCSH